MYHIKFKLLLTLLFIIKPGILSIADQTDTSYKPQFSSPEQKDTVKQLADTLSELPRLTVTPEKSMQDAFVTCSSEFEAAELLHTAGTGNGINRILALHPSALSLNSVDNNSLNIRGGAVQENLYTIDGIEFKTINHYAAEVTSGGLGFITSDNVDRVRINTIVQPCLPSRNSSVIAIDLKEIPEKN